MENWFARRRARLETWQKDRIESYGYLFGWLVGLAVVGGGIWFAQGPVCHSKVQSVQKQYQNRSAVVVSESSILSSGYYGDYGDHRAVTVRYKNWEGRPGTWQFLAYWKTQIGEREHLVINRQGVKWVENDLEARGADNPLKPGQSLTVIAGVILACILGIIVGIGVFLLVIFLRTLGASLKRPLPGPSSA